MNTFFYKSEIFHILIKNILIIFIIFIFERFWKIMTWRFQHLNTSTSSDNFYNNFLQNFHSSKKTCTFFFASAQYSLYSPFWNLKYVDFFGKCQETPLNREKNTWRRVLKNSGNKVSEEGSILITSSYDQFLIKNNFESVLCGYWWVLI